MPSAEQLAALDRLWEARSVLADSNFRHELIPQGKQTHAGENFLFLECIGKIPMRIEKGEPWPSKNILLTNTQLVRDESGWHVSLTYRVLAPTSPRLII